MVHKYSVAVVGATGYAGRELTMRLAGHPQVAALHRFSSQGGAGGILPYSLDALLGRQPDVVFLAAEHDLSFETVPALLRERIRVVDLSGAFRLKDRAAYPEWYGTAHPSPELLPEAVYGLTEWFADGIRNARLVANPGCYATAALLPLFPLFRSGSIEPGSPVVIDGKSGVSGAGRKPTERTHFCEVNENIEAYGVLRHRHTPEIAAVLEGCDPQGIIFTPHLIPITRGILNTIVVVRRDSVPARPLLESAYHKSPFVHVLPEGRFPAVRDVVHTNECHIGIAERGRHTVIVSAIDNLVKGAAGQAIQNFNVMLGCEARAGLAA